MMSQITSTHLSNIHSEILRQPMGQSAWTIGYSTSAVGVELLWYWNWLQLGRQWILQEGVNLTSILVALLQGCLDNILCQDNPLVLSKIMSSLLTILFISQVYI